MKIKLWDTPPLFDPSYGQEEPTIEPYFASGDGCIIVCAGGGYEGRCDYEAYPVAEWLQGLGINAFVLNYRYAPYKAPCMLADLQRAIRLIRKNAEEWHIDPQKIGAIGFSAGGHLVSSACTHADTGLESDDIDRLDSRLNAAILCYPVITMGEGTHAGTRAAVSGGDEAVAQFYSSEKYVSDFTPPCFIFHTFEDSCVPAIENSIAFACALRRAGRPCELHVFEHGEHGQTMLSPDAMDNEAGQWKSLCAQWLKNLNFR